MNVNTLKQTKLNLVSEARSIADAAGRENRSLTTDEATKLDALTAQISGINADIARMSTLESFEGELRNNPGRKSAPAGLGDDKEMRKALSQFSILRAAQRLCAHQRVDGVEGELSDEIARRTGRPTEGFYIPYDLAIESRANTDTSTAVGAVNHGVIYSQFIDLLRSKTILSTVGATFIPDLVGEMDIPKVNGGVQTYWVGENTAATAGNATIGSVELRQKTVAARTLLTRKMKQSSAVSLEQILRNDLALGLGLAIESAALNGTGLNDQPLGLLNNDEIGLVTVGSGTVWAAILGLESEVSTANADIGSLAYVTSPRGRGKLKQTEVATNTAQFVWDRSGQVNGYGAHASTLIPGDLNGGSEGDGFNTAVVYGSWNNMLIALFGGLEVVLDNLTDAAGGTWLKAFQSVDVKLRHNAAFAKIVDLSLA